MVRSFSVLDGIGKSLSPRFDITEISAPYARGLLLEGAPQKAALQKELKKRLGKQVLVLVEKELTDVSGLYKWWLLIGCQARLVPWWCDLVDTTCGITSAGGSMEEGALHVIDS